MPEVSTDLMVRLRSTALNSPLELNEIGPQLLGRPSHHPCKPHARSRFTSAVRFPRRGVMPGSALCANLRRWLKIGDDDRKRRSFVDTNIRMGGEPGRLVGEGGTETAPTERVVAPISPETYDAWTRSYHRRLHIRAEKARDRLLLGQVDLYSRLTRTGADDNHEPRFVALDERSHDARCNAVGS